MGRRRGQKKELGPNERQVWRKQVLTSLVRARTANDGAHVVGRLPAPVGRVGRGQREGGRKGSAKNSSSNFVECCLEKREERGKQPHRPTFFLLSLSPSFSLCLSVCSPGLLAAQWVEKEDGWMGLHGMVGVLDSTGCEDGRGTELGQKDSIADFPLFGLWRFFS